MMFIGGTHERIANGQGVIRHYFRKMVNRDWARCVIGCSFVEDLQVWAWRSRVKCVYMLEPQSESSISCGNQSAWLDPSCQSVL